MMSSTLPRGLKYKIEKVHPGIIIPGTDNEPIITISGRGAMIQYRLVSFALGKYALVDSTFSEGDLEQENLDSIDTWISQSMPSLLAEAKIRHVIYFLPNSKCYYDFLFQTLYGGNGYKEKKNQSAGFRENAASIEGNPCSLSVSEIAFINILTEYPNTPFSADRFFGEDVESRLTTLKSLDQTWYRFRQYDSSISSTFQRKRGYFIYTGNPQIWKVDGENNAPTLSMERMFKVLSTRDIVAILDENKRQFYAIPVSGISSHEMLSFLGLNLEILESTSANVDRLSKENYCDSTECLKQLLNRYSHTLEAVWNRVESNIVENYTYSLAASSFYSDTGELPERISDLSGYHVQRERFDNSLKRICPAIEEMIRDTKVGTSFFGYCNMDVTPDKVIDYIVALVLICFSNCQTPSSDEELIMLKGRYQQKLLALIRQKFNYNPPNSGNDSFIGDIEELRRRLFELEERAIADGLVAYAMEIAEMRNLYILSYNDENGLLPPSMEKNL